MTQSIRYEPTKYLHSDARCMTCVKNIPKSEVIRLADRVQVQKGQVVSMTLAQNDSVSMTIFAFDAGEEISTHTARGDAVATVLEGRGRFTVGGEPHIVTEGETIVMPVGIPHSAYAEESFKMLLVVVYPYDDIVKIS